MLLTSVLDKETVVMSKEVKFLIPMFPALSYFLCYMWLVAAAYDM